jgi:hypothetical protein
VDHDFRPTGYLKSLSADGCYSLMRRKNNSKKGNQKKAMMKRKAVPSVSSKKIQRTSKTFILNCHFLFPYWVEYFSLEWRRASELQDVLRKGNRLVEAPFVVKTESQRGFFQLKQLSSIPSGEVLDEDLVQESQYHVSCFTQDMKNAKGTDYEDLQKSKVLDFVRHFQVYHAVVER